MSAPRRPRVRVTTTPPRAVDHATARAWTIVTTLARVPGALAEILAVLDKGALTEAHDWFRAQHTPEADAVSDALVELAAQLDAARGTFARVQGAGGVLKGCVGAYLATLDTDTRTEVN